MRAVSYTHLDVYKRQLYARMAALLKQGASEVDLAPMVHVADALTLGKRVVTDAFEF